MARTTKADFKLEMPSSLREVIIDDLHALGEPIPTEEDAINKLMKRVYSHIEKEALKTYHSAEPWALRSWALSNILRDTVANEVSNQIAHELISPVMEWQESQPFDPIGYFRERLEFERKSDRTVECYMLTASRFVAGVGRKRHYTDEDVEQYLAYANKHYENQDSYYQECRRLLQFLRRLPEADRQRQLPIKMPKMPDEFYQPTFTKEQVETLIWSTVLDNIPANMVVRLAVASIYGARRSELTELSSKDIQLNGDNSTIFIRTKKGGQKKTQPIPKSLLPLFDISISPMHGHTVQRQLKKICKNAGVLLPFRGGYHCFRRSTVTVVSEAEPSDINVSNFMRWAKPRSMLARYKQTPIEVTDKQILDKHPYVKMWEEAVPFVLKFNPDYAPLNDNT